MKWAAIEGEFEFSDPTITFKGAPATFTNSKGEQQVGLGVGLAMNSEVFSSGEISAQIEFEKVVESNACEIVFYYDPVRRWYVSVGIGGAGAMYIIRHWEGKWIDHAIGGRRQNLRPKQPYEVKVSVRGSRVALFVDGVEVIGAVLPFAITPSQTGLWCLDDSNVRIKNYRVANRHGRVFVVMQFSSPFTELYAVIKKVCEAFNLDAHKSDETYGPGIVISDIALCAFPSLILH